MVGEYVRDNLREVILLSLERCTLFVLKAGKVNFRNMNRKNPNVSSKWIWMENAKRVLWSLKAETDKNVTKDEYLFEEE